VVHTLATSLAGVTDDTKARVGEVIHGGEVGDGFEQGTGAVDGLGRVDALHVLFGQNKDMHRCDGVYIGDGQNGIVFVKNFSRNLLGDNAAKNTGHCFSHLPKLLAKNYFTYLAISPTTPSGATPITRTDTRSPINSMDPGKATLR